MINWHGDIATEFPSMVVREKPGIKITVIQIFMILWRKKLFFYHLRRFLIILDNSYELRLYKTREELRYLYNSVIHVF